MAPTRTWNGCRRLPSWEIGYAPQRHCSKRAWSVSMTISTPNGRGITNPCAAQPWLTRTSQLLLVSMYPGATRTPDMFHLSQFSTRPGLQARGVVDNGGILIAYSYARSGRDGPLRGQ